MSSSAATGYLLCYILIVAPLLVLFSFGRTTSPKTLPSLKALSPTQLSISALLLLNLAGLPPLGGFCLKAASLAILAPVFPLISLILILSSVATLGFYINITLLSLITSFETLTPINQLNKLTTSPLFALTILSSVALPIFPLLLL